MILDARLELSDAQSVVHSSAGGTTSGESVINLGTGTDAWGTAITPDIGEAGVLTWNVQIATTLAGTDAGISVALKCSASEDMSSATTLATLAFAATAAAGTKKSIKLPAGTIQQYLRADTTITATKTLTAGAIDSWIALDHESSH